MLATRHLVVFLAIAVGLAQGRLVLRNWHAKSPFQPAPRRFDDGIKWQIGKSTVDFVRGEPDIIIVKNRQNVSSLTIDFRNPLRMNTVGDATVKGHEVFQLDEGESMALTAESIFDLTICAGYRQTQNVGPIDRITEDLAHGGFAEDYSQLTKAAKWCATLSPWTVFMSPADRILAYYPEEQKRLYIAKKIFDSFHPESCLTVRPDIYFMQYDLIVSLKGPMMSVCSTNPNSAFGLITPTPDGFKVKFIHSDMDIKRRRRIHDQDLLVYAWINDGRPMQVDLLDLVTCINTNPSRCLGDDREINVIVLAISLFPNSEDFLSFTEMVIYKLAEEPAINATSLPMIDFIDMASQNDTNDSPIPSQETAHDLTL